jgi:hypothetical protein
MSPVLEVCLPRSGFARNFLRVVLFGPHKYQGQGLSHPWCTQEIMKLGVLWEAFTKPSLESDVLLTNMELLRMEFGTDAPMTDIPFSRMDKATTKSWVKSAWRSCQKFGLHIEGSLPKPTLKRQGDCFLMQLFCDDPTVTNSDLRLLQTQRMFMSVETLSDIVSACGTHILASAYQGSPAETNLHNYIWPRRPNKLSDKHLRKWQLTLDKLVANPHSQVKELIQPLGTWQHDKILQWKWFLDPTTATLWHKEGPFFIAYSSLRGNQGSVHHREPNPVQLCHKLPTGTVRASVHRTHSKSATILSTSSQMDPPPPKAAVPTTLAEARAALPKGDQWAVAHLRYEDEGRAVAESIKNGTCAAVDDGPYKPHFGTSAAIAKDMQIPGPELVGLNVVPGDPSYQSSY